MKFKDKPNMRCCMVWKRNDNVRHVALFNVLKDDKKWLKWNAI